MRRVVALLAWVAFAAAAVGPDHLAVVVNGDSWASRAIANHYIELRGIPPENVVILHGVDAIERITVADFRDRMLRPTLAAIAERGLTARIEAIAWSADLPTRIDCRDDLAEEKFPRTVGRVASSTGLTLLAPLVLRGGPHYLPLVGHDYFRPDGRPNDQPPAAVLPRYGKAMRRWHQPVAEDLDEAAAEAAKAANLAAALTILRELDAEVDHRDLAYNLACAEARSLEHERAFAALARSAELGFWDESHARRDRDLEGLREDPRFAAALERMRANARAFVPVETRGFARRDRSLPTGGVAPRPLLASAPLLACHLAVTTGRGLGVAEALAQLERSVAADGTRPEGTVYLMRNGDVRSTTREWAFERTRDELESLGQPTEILRGTVPKDRDDVVGAVIGIAGFDLAASGVGILPGALCEHLTSFGGVLRHSAGQTPLTAWLRHGAAGATGTVVEPYALQAKFPTPFVQLHYRRGASLIEAVWQSVQAPYQLLLVGDPLCAPWAEPPEIELAGLPADGVLSAPLTITVRSPDALGWIQASIDGRPVHDGPETAFTIDPTGLVPGHHRLRVIAARDDAIATVAVRSAELRTAGTVPELAVTTELTWGGTCQLQRGADSDAELALALPGGRLVALDERGRAEIPAAELGLGTTRGRVVALDDTGGIAARGRELAIHVAAPEPLPALELAGEPLPGARVLDGGILEQPCNGDWLGAAGLEAGGSVVGLVASEGGLHQLRVIGDRVAALAVDGQPIALDPAGGAPLWLAPGWHRLAVEITPGDGPCSLHFGSQGEPPLTPETFRHAGDAPNP